MNFGSLNQWIDYSGAVKSMGCPRYHTNWLHQYVGTDYNNIESEEQLAIANSISLLYDGLIFLFKTDEDIVRFMNKGYENWRGRSPWDIICTSPDHIHKRCDIVLKLAMAVTEPRGKTSLLGW